MSTSFNTASVLAVRSGQEVVAHVMRADDEGEDAGWVGGLVVDAEQQHRGIGTGVIRLLVDAFSKDGYGQAALSYDSDNVIARNLYAKLGFVETGELADDELVARRPLTPPT